MQLGIKAKFIGILMVASVLPLCIAIIGIWVLGHYYYQKERGILFQAEAVHLAQSLDQVVQNRVEELHDWLALSELGDQIQRHDQSEAGLPEAERRDRARLIQSRWRALLVKDPEVQAVLTNDIARALDAFRSTSPLFAQILVTDARGRVIGATGKPADYLQAGSSWWQKTLALPADHPCIEGINFDPGTGLYSLTVAYAIPNPSQDDSSIGAIRGIIDAPALFSSVHGILPYEHPVREIMMGDGRVLISLFDRRAVPRGERVDPLALDRLAENQAGWATLKLDGNTLRLVGFAPVHFADNPTGEVAQAGAETIHVIVHDDARRVLAPVHKQFWILAAAGVWMLLTFSTAGLYIADRKIIGPIKLLRSAAQTISATAHLEGGSQTERRSTNGVKTMPPLVLLERMKQIQTGDEIEDLARDFTVMARRVLSYHELLKQEIASKTAELQRDLDLAREFQEALLPHTYPQVPSANVADPLMIRFHHLYKPTSSVGGDFFDVVKLSDHRAGVFIADVMGHGTRSALVTAMLRTLLQDLAQQADDPANFLTLMNRQFHEIIAESNQFIFASAFYLIVDTEKAQASYASAGHPSPFQADRNTKEVSLLIQGLKGNPALGLYSDSVYTGYTRPIKDGDLFLLYTDGVPEALNEQGEEFSRERLQQIIEQSLDHDADKLTRSILDAVNTFLNSAPLPDDVCLVTVEVDAAKPRARGKAPKAARA